MLSENEKLSLGRDVSKFLAWLRGKVDSPNTDMYDFIEFSPPDPSDWFMNVPKERIHPVKFNTFARQKCSFDYYRMIVIHECFHLLVQNVPNKLDAKRLKDDFGDTFMTFLDIEADYYTSIFLKEFYSYDLSQIFELNYSGSRVFGDLLVRVPKYERFISSSLTIVNYFLNKNANSKEIFLVSTKNIPTENKMHAIISKNTHFEAFNFDAPEESMKILKKCYKREFDSREQYASNIIQSCIDILGLHVRYGRETNESD